MALPTFTMRQLLEAGVHFGHNTRRWNPKMAPYIFGVRNGIHIIDLQQTAPLLYRAMTLVRDTVAGGGRVLFVGTKRQASERVAEAAKRCGQYYVNHRWLGGMLTNWQTVSKSIRRLRELDEMFAGDTVGLTKKELLRLTRERDKLDRALGGIKEMGGKPDVMVVIDTNKEGIAVAEANRLNIPVVAVIDSNSSPDGIDYPVPGNDDALRAINIYCELIAGSVLDGIQQEVVASGGDLGEKEVTPVEDLSASPPVEEAAPAAEKKPVEAAPAVAEEAAPAVEEKPAEEAPAVAEEATPAAEEKPAEEAPAAAKEEPAEDAKADA
ncbi:MAG: 30S ribosomal protein S2 [Rhodospirillaceae bacterium]|nr:30S ribosomal protein S2 [Rhodospirillaceae bacterium]